MSTIGSTVDDVRSPQRGSDYATLLNQVRQAGLLERRPFFYTVSIAVNLALLAGGWLLFFWLGNSWWQIGTAVVLAVAFAQNGFLTHDAGHKQIFRSRKGNQIVGWLHGNLAVGLAFGWWSDKHNRHHAHPNQEGLDPDINGENLAYTEAQVSSRRRLGRLLARYQGALFFPMLTLLAISMRESSVRAMMQPKYRNRVPEAVLFGLHVVGYLTVVLLVLSPVKALVFVAVHQALLGVYLGSVFAPNHKGMPILSADDDSDFLRRQVLTARNVRGGRLTDVMLGGLNYQIEHHLFPSMPHPSLRRARPIVREYCLTHGLTYAETGLFESYGQALRHLSAVGKGAPRPALAGIDGGSPAAPVD